jgi:hypothetical protein
MVPHTICCPPRPERLVQFGAVDAVQPDQLVGDDDSVAVDDFGGAGEAIGATAERQDGDETPEHSAPDAAGRTGVAATK